LLVDLALWNAKIYTAGEVLEGGVAIEDGRIFKVAREPNLPTASKRIDLEGRLVLPGLIDVHVHLRDQQLAYKEDFYSGTVAAAAGGVTLGLDMPNNKPVTMSAEALIKRMRMAETRVVVNVAFFSAFPKHLREMQSIVEEGTVGFKLYMPQRIGGLDIYDDEMLLQGFNEAEQLDVPVAVHAEDVAMLEKNRRKMKRGGRKGIDAYQEVHSIEAEQRATRRAIGLAKKSGVHIHFCHVSSATALKAILKAKTQGLPVTCEVTPHNLLLSSEDLQHQGALALTDPPLRTKRHAEALWKGLEQGFVDLIATDHAPHTIEEKEVESIWLAKPGIPGLETLLPLLLTQVNRGRLTISDLVRVTSEKPAEIFGLLNRGRIERGYCADLTVVDLDQEEKIVASNFYSKAKYSPFDGWTVTGRPVKTFVSGRLVMDDGEIVAEPGTGQVIRR
jgi:dihydroorotase (multifunctional complex type)